MKSSLFATPSHPAFGWESGAGVDTQHTSADVRTSFL